MELENIVANSVYLHARECADFGRSKKWREMLKFPHYTECVHLKNNLDTSFEKIFLKEPIGKKLFEKFCMFHSSCSFIMNFLNELEKFRSADNNTDKISIIKNIKNYLCESSSNLNEFSNKQEIQNTNKTELPNHNIESVIENPVIQDSVFLRTKLKEVKYIKDIVDGEVFLRIINNLSFDIPFDYFDNFYCNILEYLKVEPFELFLNSHFFLRYLQWKTLEKRPVSDKFFRLYRTLGKGGFGEVCASQSKITGKMYAMKKWDKKRIKKKRYESLVLNEKKILEKLDSRFVINLAYAYQNKTSLVLVVNLMMGGDLRFHIHLNKPNGLSLNLVFFYAAEILLGLSYMHSKDIAYRDMKPDNVLLDDKGHIRISDLGLAVNINANKQISSSVGTLGYMAPEVINHQPYTFGPDWWSFACVIYEMIECRIPFRKHKEKITEEDIRNRTLQGVIEYTSKFSSDAVNLCSKFFVVDQTQRLGYNKEDTNIIKSHPFFKGICWNLLEIGKVNPPFVPDPRAVYCKDVGEIGEFAGVRGVVLDEKDFKFHAKFSTGSISIHWQNEMIESGVFDEIDLYGPNNEPSRDLYGYPPPPPPDTFGCCGFLKSIVGKKTESNKIVTVKTNDNEETSTSDYKNGINY